MTDLEIAQNYKKKPIIQIAKKYGIDKKDLELYGDYKAKLNCKKLPNKHGKLILVTATNPTKFGEGKTTVSIGLCDALSRLGKKSALALREPSLGPVFGIKGGATGGGKSQVVPMDDINLHFNGDFHAVTSANNLICAMIDNSLYYGNPLNLNPETINFNRCIDMNDRALRSITLNVEGKYIRKEKFNITSASEMMAIATLARDIDDLKARIDNICIGFDYDGRPVFAKGLNCTDAVAILLKDAIKPNLIQTLEGNPAVVHLGPFANISHGCNSIVATKTAMSISDYTVTEAGFGADLGAQKFLDLVCNYGNFKPNAIVLITTIRSLKLNSGMNSDDVYQPNVDAMIKGTKILFKHYDNLVNVYKANVVVTINKFYTDTDKEIKELLKLLKEKNIPAVVSEPYSKGGKGCVDLAKKVIKLAQLDCNIVNSYEKKDKVEVKIDKIVKNIYGAEKLTFSQNARDKLDVINRYFRGYDVVIAKTQYSLSDDAKQIGVTQGFEFTISDFQINSGAGYIVAIAGKMLLMPGLSKVPNAVNMKIDNNCKVEGIF